MVAKRKRKPAKGAPVGEVASAMLVPPPASPAESAPSEVVRADNGTWLPGQSGNPAGRIKGARNRLTIERLALETALREYIANPDNLLKLKLGIDRILNIAVYSVEDKNAVAAFKILADKVLTAPKDSGEQEQNTPHSVTVVIENMTTVPKKVNVDIEDADYDELDDPPL
jgi:hypothetical protein